MKTNLTTKKNGRIALPALLACLCLFFTTTLHAQNCTVNAGVPQSICGSSTNLAGNLNGTYSANATWTFVSGPAIPTIVSPSSLTSQVTNMTASGVYVFRLSLVCQSGDTVSQTVNITANPMPTFTAGTDFSFCGNSGSPTMNATLPSGWTGTWSVLDATSPTSVQTSRFTFSDIHSPTATVQYTTPGCPLNSYLFKWEVTSPSGLCKYSQTVHGVWKPDPATLSWSISPGTFCMGSLIQYIKSSGTCGFWSGYNPDYVFTTSMISAPAGFAGAITIGTSVGGDINVNGLNVAGHYVFNEILTTPCGNKTIGPFDITILPPPPTVTGSTTVAYCIRAIPSSVPLSFTLADSTTQFSVTGSTVPSGAGSISIVSSGAGYIRAFTVTPNTHWAAGDYTVSFKAVNAQDTNGYCPKSFYAVIVVYDSLPINMGLPTANVCIPTGSTTVDATIALPGYANYLTQDYGPRYYLTKLSGPSAGPGNVTAPYYGSAVVLPGLKAGKYKYKIQPLPGSQFADEMACSSGPYADSFSINVYNATGANAGTDQSVNCIQNYPLAGNTIPAPSYGTWAQVSGPSTMQFTNVHSPNALVGTTAPVALLGTYMFSWTTNDSNNSCPVYTDTVIVTATNNCSAPLIVLALQVTAFNVENVNGMARLNWSTASEEDLESFTAEWSITGGRNNDWQPIGTLPAKGSITGANYSIMHSPTPGSTNYYRIRAAERNGSYEYSAVAKLALDGSKSVPQVFPRPVTDMLQVNSLEDGSMLSLYSSEGMLLWKGTAAGSEVHVDMRAYGSGLYLLNIQTHNGDRLFNYKIIKQ